jgi:hypothetical protein
MEKRFHASATADLRARQVRKGKQKDQEKNVSRPLRQAQDFQKAQSLQKRVNSESSCGGLKTETKSEKWEDKKRVSLAEARVYLV